MKTYNPLSEKKYIVMLFKSRTGVVAFDNIFAMDEVQAVKYAMNEAFKMFPDSKFGLYGYEVTDGDFTVRTEKLPIKYLGRL